MISLKVYIIYCEALRYSGSFACYQNKRANDYEKIWCDIWNEPNTDNREVRITHIMKTNMAALKEWWKNGT